MRWGLPLTVLLISGCSSAIRLDVGRSNATSRDAAIRDALEQQQAIATALPTEYLVLPSSLGRCAEPEVLLQASHSTGWLVDCESLLGALRIGSVLRGRTLDGTRAALVLAESASSPGNDRHVIARTPDDGWLVLKPHLVIVETRRVHVAGFCNKMPSPQEPHAGPVAFWALLNTEPEQVTSKFVPFDGAAIETECDRTAW
ncbi:MAG: hypothetical protein QM817_09455 [Archangium sp.]